MRFSRARYVTLCQQSLVTAAVLAVGLSAAGVNTLDIVPQPGPIAGVRDVPGGLPQDALAEHAAKPPARTKVDTAPVTPKVREVKVKGISTKAPLRAARTQRLVAVSDPQPVRGYATVGVTWKHGLSYSADELTLQVRTAESGSWSAWRSLSHDEEDGPDSDSAEQDGARSRPGTDALVIGDVDRVQMRAETRDGSAPPDLSLAIIDPGTGAMAKEAPAIDTAELGTTPEVGQNTTSGDQSQAAGAGEARDTVALSAMNRAPKPKIYSRAQWGANERLRDQSAPDYGTVKTGFIHHTVNANNYSSAQVPALLRGIYAYHTQSRGWRDIGYNYLVDRFGRIWEGRYGGVDRAVVGAHTLGYNEVSFAMSAIGNFDIASPPQRVLDAFEQLFAWKLSNYDIAANKTRIYVKNRYLQAINGHRNVGQTACPGRYLYAKIPGIRIAARHIQRRTGSEPSTPRPVFTSPTQTPLPAVPQPSKISLHASRNLSGTTRPDLVLKERSTGAIRVLPTGGQAGFDHSVSTPGGWRSMDLIAAVGDVSGDGKGDVLARLARTGLTRVYRGNGIGGVRTTGAYTTSRFRGADMITAAGDWNADGKADVLMREKAKGWLYLVPGTGTGGFGAPVVLSRSWSGFSSTAVAGDLTRDGRPDIVAVRNGVVHVVANTLTGALGTSVERQTVGSAYDAVVGGGRDLNGDSTGDVILRSASTGRLGIMVGRSDASFGPTLGWFPGPAGLAKMSAGQMMGGERPDVVGTNATGSRLVVLPSNGEVNVYKVPRANLRVPTATQVFNVGDWNRDGKGDIITRQSDGDLLMFRPGKGDGRFSKGVVMSTGWDPITELSAVGDVTGDGHPDLVGKTSTGPMTIFPGNGRTSFKAPVLAPASLRTFNQVGSGSWRPSEMPGSSYLSSDGSFVPFTRTNGEDLSRYDWVIGPGDVSGNGVADMIARDSDGTLWLLPGTSRGYGERRFLSGGYAGYSLGG
ncbi:MAG: FG-GAP-like repeat-containing protein [Marmoricola sp.]